MTLAADKRDERLALVDSQNGLVERRIFSDQEVYEAELENIFGRTWNFMCHESQIPKTGDFFSSTIGEDKVICVRDKEGQFQVLLNSCRHRGNAVCRAEEGHASAFMCAYHGWTYDLRGDLVGVPGFKEIYRGDLDKSQWGLAKAAKVANYRGFIFATMDPETPDLDEYLGEVGKYCIDVLADKGNIKVVPGVQKYVIPCNWKFAVENVWDSYHAEITHLSAFMANAGTSAARNDRGAMKTYWSTMLGEYGHAQLLAVQNEDMDRLTTFGVDDREVWLQRIEASKKLSPPMKTDHGNIFPNLWVTGRQLSLRVPRGPLATEIWWFTVLDADQPEEQYKTALSGAIHGFGPAGMAEQDDGDNWTLGTLGTKSPIGRRKPFNYAANLGRGQIIEDELGPPRIYAAPAENAQLWFYKAWSEWIASSDWRDFEQTHSAAPEGYV
jgi:phenylpropionate dioxygenase-like ring-hydroxylating dioxygenase large terminal subunit